MASYQQSAGRNLKSPKFYSTSSASGKEGYNPQIKVYYGSDDNLVRVEETWRGKVWSQTISGSNYAQQWPNYSYYEVYNPWEESDVTTASG
jgi:hypothetical protein